MRGLAISSYKDRWNCFVVNNLSYSSINQWYIFVLLFIKRHCKCRWKWLVILGLIFNAHKMFAVNVGCNLCLCMAMFEEYKYNTDSTTIQLRVLHSTAQTQYHQKPIVLYSKSTILLQQYLPFDYILLVSIHRFTIDILLTST